METPTAIASAYAALGVTIGYNPVPPEQLRIWLISYPGHGKSTFLSSIPDTLILDFEQGCDAVPGARAHRVYVENKDHLDSIIQLLIKDGENKVPKYKRICFDTVDQMAQLIAAPLAREKKVETIMEYGQKGAGYALLANRVWKTFESLKAAGYTWATAGHIKDKTVTLPGSKQEITKQSPCIFDSIGQVVTRNSDFFATLLATRREEKPTKTITIPTPNGEVKQQVPDTSKPIQVIREFRLSIANLDSRDSKSRGVPEMRTEIKLPLYNGWDAFAAEYKEAVKRTKENLKSKGLL
jgi:hypothetical protein